MKRARQDTTPRHSPLGVSEFTSALNGDDANAVWRALRRFTRTVKRERCQALADENDQDDQESEEEDLTLEESSSSKRHKKQEKWMEDTKSYNVPFVGTSVAKGDTGRVKRGQWPTGLLQAYLKSSPLATELTGASLVPPHGVVHRSLLKRQNGNKYSHQIHVAYLGALEQLLTAAIPIATLKRDMGITDQGESDANSDSSNSHDRFMTPLVKDRLPGLLGLIQQHNKGDLVAMSFRVLTNLAATSVGTSRMIARSLDESLKSGTLRAVLRRRREKKEDDNEDREQPDADEQDEKKRSTKALSCNVQTACIRLAATLLESGDGIVVSLISTAGSKERKINPGIIYLALRNGLDHPLFDKKPHGDNAVDPLYLKAVSKLISAVQVVLISSPSNSDKSIGRRRLATQQPGNKVMSHKALADLLSGDALERICHVAMCSPLSSSEILEGRLTFKAHPVHHSNTLEGVSMEGRRLLFPLLSNTTQSPFLSRLESSGGRTATLYTQQLVRALCLVINANGKIPIQKFVLQCVANAPPLLPALFRMLTIPDPSRKCFAFMSRMSLLRLLVQHGPVLGNGSHETNPDQVLLWVIPFHMKKFLLNKGIQSANNLVVAETLKLMIALFKRYQDVVIHNSLESEESVLEAFSKRLPELQALLAACSRFDPFADNSSGSSSIVTGHLCDLFIMYATVLPRAINAVKFDWIKLLPQDKDVFVRSSPLLQLKLLRTLETIRVAQKDAPQSQKVSSNSCRVLLDIMLATGEQEIYRYARKQALSLIVALTQKGSIDNESKECLHYEASLWVDGITKESMTELIALLDVFGQLSFQHAIRVAEAWKKHFPSEPMRRICFSPLLTAALSSRNSASTSFSVLAHQVVFRCLLYHQCPLALAALVDSSWPANDRDSGSCQAESPLLSNSGGLLLRYSQSLLDFSSMTKQQRSELLKSLLEALFPSDTFRIMVVVHNTKLASSKDSFRRSLQRLYESSPSSFGQDGISTLRLFLHVMVCEQFESDVNSLNSSFSLFGSYFGLVLQDPDHSIRSRAIETVFGHPFVRQQRFSSIESFYLALMALFCSSSGSKRPAGCDALVEVLSNSSEGVMKNISKPISEKAEFTRETTRRSILCLAMLIPAIQPCHALEITKELLKMCCLSVCSSRDKDSLPLSVSFALLWLQGCSEIEENGAESVIPGHLVFESWCKLRRLQRTGIQHKDIESICDHLEVIMVKLLHQEDRGLASSMLYSNLLQMTPEDFVDLCLYSKTIASATAPNGDDSFCFLSSVLECDCMRFAPPVIKRSILSTNGKYEVKDELRVGSLDRALSVIVKNKAFEDNTLYGQAACAVSGRVASILEGVNELSGMRQHCVILDTFVVAVNQSRLFPETTAQVVDAVTVLLISINEKSISRRDTLVEGLLRKLALSLCCSIDSSLDTESTGSASRALLASALLVRLCDDLQKTLRHLFHRRDTPTTESGGHPPEELIEGIRDIIGHAKAFDSTTIGVDGSPFVGLVRACLKYGVIDAERNGVAVSADCLELVRTLVTEVHNVSSSFKGIQLSELLEPSRIFAMVTSHSKFALALSMSTDHASGRASSSERPKLELVRLLLCCVSLSSRRISFDSEVWDALLAGYNAGVSPVDCAMRRLFQVYSDLSLMQQKETEMPFMHEFRWADTALVNKKQSRIESSNETASKRWDWLINGLDMSRVRATLSQFPVWDYMECQALPDVEVWLTAEDDIEDETDESMTNSTDDATSSSISSNDAQDSAWKSMQSKSSSYPIAAGNLLDEWNGIGPDIRYSPAFVLPLVFGALESFSVEQEKPDLSQTGSDLEQRDAVGGQSLENTSDENPVNGEAFAVAAHRLCERGALSLALASLSSKCSALRQLAVATLGLFLRALHLKEARELASWRDRPQVAMVLNSLQRGLAIRRASQLSYRDGLPSPADLLVPMLPAVSAIFLARASLIVVKPGDALFAALNKFFLRIDDDCGAYQDISRLPAFISLFCSASDEPGQSRRERLWALQQVKDGFVDEFCFRAVASCHAPELVLTTFDSYASRYEEGDSDLERILLLDTITTIVTRGGHRAARHLIGRVGLLSWLRAILIGRPTSQVLPTVACKKAFLCLLSAAVQSASTAQETSTVDIESFVVEVSNLARPVLQLYADSIDHGVLEQGKRCGEDDDDSFVVSVCNSLACLATAVKQVATRSTSTSRVSRLLGVRPHGMQLSSIEALLSRSPATSMDKLIESVRILPVAFDPHEAMDAASLCERILRFVLSKSRNDSTLAVEVIRIVSVLLKFFGSELDPSGEILPLVLACRRSCFDCPGGQQAWLDCLTNLLDRQSDAYSDAKATVIAKDIVSQKKLATKE